MSESLDDASIAQALAGIQSEMLAEIENADSPDAIQAIKVNVFGKKGVFNHYYSQLKQADPEQKKSLGQTLHQAKMTLSEAIERRADALDREALNQAMAADAIDVTLPGRGEQLMRRHPIHELKSDVLSMFARMGFEVLSGPEIESQDNNFTLLNMPENHPARASHDTFYFGDGRLLRTHTSTIQIRALSNRQPPIRIVGAGRVFRRDHDMTHSPMFHQMEGLVIDKDINFCQLKTLIISFLEALFGSETEIRFRPSYFPFTEPSAEVDIALGHGNQKKWLEVLGCGMVHPNVLGMSHIDPEVYSGFAFGLGLDRFAMIKYGIQDLRSMFMGDLSFLTEIK